MSQPLSNDELIKLRSRLYRGFRAPMAVTQFFGNEQIVSTTRDPSSGNVSQIIQKVTYPDGTEVIKTTDFILDGSGNIQASNVTYSYADTTT